MLIEKWDADHTTFKNMKPVELLTDFGELTKEELDNIHSGYLKDEQKTEINLTPADKEIFFDTLMNLEKSNNELILAAKRFKQQLKNIKKYVHR